jgi:hypothetical protein
MRLPDLITRLLRRRLLALAERRPPDVRIGAPDDDYLRRWFVIPRNRFFNVYLHNFRRSDDDRALHDHPWWNVSLLLDGAYIEHTIPAGGVNVRKYYEAGNLKFRTAKAAHRVELIRATALPAFSDQVPPESPCWSLFITGPNIRSWGFHCPTRWVPWQEFTNPANPGEIGKGCGEGTLPRHPRSPAQPQPGDA